jgi:hypothetical protein
LLEPVQIDHHDRRTDLRIGARKGERRFKPVCEQLAVGQAGEVVVNGVKKQPVLGVLEVRHVCEGTDEPHDFSV